MPSGRGLGDSSEKQHLLHRQNDRFIGLWLAAPVAPNPTIKAIATRKPIRLCRGDVGRFTSHVSALSDSERVIIRVTSQATELAVTKESM